jgi:hypothetical protein
MFEILSSQTPDRVSAVPRRPSSSTAHARPRQSAKLLCTCQLPPRSTAGNAAGRAGVPIGAGQIRTGSAYGFVFTPLDIQGRRADIADILKLNFIFRIGSEA